VPGITVSTVSGFGRGLGGVEGSRRVDDAPMIKIEVVVPDALAEQVVETIARSAHTGRGGDGKIFVSEVADVVKIRTGERGEAAI
jgi:nitrogen regulatory protein P-II 1